eukprot:scaffold50007_cov32-Tisochrysis_lutea.AAC.1
MPSTEPKTTESKSSTKLKPIQEFRKQGTWHSSDMEEMKILWGASVTPSLVDVICGEILISMQATRLSHIINSRSFEICFDDGGCGSDDDKETQRARSSNCPRRQASTHPYGMGKGETKGDLLRIFVRSVGRRSSNIRTEALAITTEYGRIVFIQHEEGLRRKRLRRVAHV